MTPYIEQFALIGRLRGRHVEVQPRDDTRPRSDFAIVEGTPSLRFDFSNIVTLGVQTDPEMLEPFVAITGIDTALLSLVTREELEDLISGLQKFVSYFADTKGV